MTEVEKLQYENALAYAEKKHAGQLRLGGEPYVTHPVAVAEILKERGYGVDYLITALFHDLLEDTDATEGEIAEIAGERILQVVILLTKTKGYVMADYVAGIQKDAMAYVVKGADRLHNLRSAFCTSKKFRRDYIKETREWYMDFMPEIPEAVAVLEASLEHTEYDDIINRPHPVSKNHMPMAVENRAAQFAPFAALTGYEDAVRETARLTERKKILDQDAKAVLDEKLQIIRTHMQEEPDITVTYFQADEKKEGGKHLTFGGKLKKIDEVDCCLCFCEGVKIPMVEIVDLQGDIFA